MKLPSIEYGPVQDAASSVDQVDQSRRRALGAMAEGLQAFGQEVIKTQSQAASAKVDEGMAQLTADLNSRRYVSAKEVRDQLGPDFDRLPEAVKGQLTQEVTDPSTGELVQVDRDQVPTWVVAGALFDRRARDLVRQASQGITAEGWRAEFQQHAMADAVRAKGQLNEQQMRAMLEDQKDSQRATVEQFVRLRSYDRALDTIQQSRVYSGGEKALLTEQVLQRKQQDTALDKVLSAAVDAASVRRPNGEVDQVEAQKRLDARTDLTGEERLKAQSVLEDRIRQAHSGYEQQLGTAILAAKAAWENGDPKRGIRPYTDPNISVPREVQAVLRNAANPGGPDAWEQLLGWHQTFVARERGNRQIPTAEQVELAATVEADIVRRTQKGDPTYRDMEVGTFVTQYAPKLTQPQFDRVFQLFLAANGKTPQAPRIVNNKAILLEAMPEEWRPKAVGRGVKAGDPETWPANGRPWAAWVDLSEDLDTWLRANPGAGDKEVRDHVKQAVADRTVDVLRERSWTWGQPSQVYGFELRRRSDLNARGYQPDETFEPKAVPGIPDGELPAMRDALKKQGLPPTLENLQQLWNSRPGAQPAQP